MAEGWARALQPDRVEAFSAGTCPAGLDRLAVQVMAEAGVDISAQRSKHVMEFWNAPLDRVITLCDHAREVCPVSMLPAPAVHVGFDDPPSLALRASTPGEALEHYRRVRDEIRDLIEHLPEGILDLAKPPASRRVTEPPYKH
jgi:arsenate reductase